MYFKQKLVYMGLGCLFTIIGYILASLGGDVTAQSEEGKSAPTIVDEIVCRKLKVVNANGQPLVVINTDYIGGLISIKGADGTSSVLIGTLPKGGFMRVVGADGENAVKIATDFNGGYIYVNNADSKPAVSIGGSSDGGVMSIYHQNGGPSVSISTDSNGGYMDIRHASGEKAILMGIRDTSKEGFVKVQGKDHEGLIQLGANKYGGSMAIFNKGSQNVLQAGVGDTGAGIINTRDKHGYRTGRLP